MRGRVVSMLGAGALTAFAVVGSAAPAFAGASITANPDDVHTTVNTAVTFDPTANDTALPPFTIDHIQIESLPSHGTATLQSDHLHVTYVPDDGYVGADGMEYNVIACMPVPKVVPAGLLQNCVEATGPVKITVDPAPATTTTVAPDPTTTVAVVQQASSTTAAPVTTVAPAAASLPRTGSTSGGLASVGAFAVALGSALLLLLRRRNAPVS